MLMKVCIYGSGEQSKDLKNKVVLVLEELGLTDFVPVEASTNADLKKELDISQESALIIEEESIDFKDMIFEGMIPDDAELKSMFVSIIWWSSGGWCAPEWCGSGCSC